MSKSIKFSDLQALPEDQRNLVLANLIKETQKPVTQEDLDVVNKTISMFETKYNMVSSELVRKVTQGEIKATWEIHQWLMQIHRRDHLLGRQSI